MNTLAAVVEGAQRTPGRRVAFDLVAEVERVDVDAGGDRRVPASAAAFCRRKAMSWSCAIGPGDRRHIGLLGGAELEMVGAPVGVDDEIGDEVRRASV